MSLGLIKPGASAALRHPKTGAILEPIGYIRGKAVWPALGASPDDPDDPEFTGEGDDDEDDDSDDDDDDEDDKSRTRRKKKTSKSKEDDDEDDEDDDDGDGPPKAVRQAKNYRLRLRQAERDKVELQTRLKELENKDRKPEEVASEDLQKARTDLESMTEVNQALSAQLAFFKTRTGIEWVDPTDVFALAEREGLFDDVIDEDGNVDTRELRRGLKDLAKRKPYLVVPVKSSGRADDKDDDDEEEDERPRRSARSGNSTRRGSRQNSQSRAALASKFPVLRNL